jgi:tetraacyldisaccharide 4'-kinase
LVNLDELNKKSDYVAFAGIGIPENFYTTLINSGLNIVKFIEYPDHWKYNYKEIEKIINIAKNMNAKIITTEKDYMKINPNENYDIKFLKIEIKVKDENELIDYLRSHI